MKNFIFICEKLVLLILLLCFTQCKDNDRLISSNITLYDKPLPVIQANIKGNWKLLYSAGGFSYQEIVDADGSYMKLSPNHIIMGNNTYGVTTDSPIIWEKAETSFTPSSTYLLRYNCSWLDDRMISNTIILYEIRNDTLVIGDGCFDGFTSYYTKY